MNMRNLRKFLVLLIPLIIFGSSAALAELSDVCPTTRALLRGEIYKSKQSNHISRKDRRSKSTAFITLRGTKAPVGSCINVYSANGVLVHMMGRYNPAGAAYSSRFYGGTGCGRAETPAIIAARAYANSGSWVVYIKVNSNLCVAVPRANKCWNSSSC